MGKMDAQMKNMQGMHEKMMKAKSAEERNALMAEHMKFMQEGMTMMEGMGGMQGKSAISGDMPMQHQMMEKRMEMMKSMMQMMQDRMPVAPAK